METVRERNMRRTNPESVYVARMERLVLQFEEELKRVKEDRKNSIFEDLEPAKEVARKEVEKFKGDVDAKINSVVAELRSTKDKMLHDAHEKIEAQTEEFFGTKAALIAEEVSEDMRERKQEGKEWFTTLKTFVESKLTTLTSSFEAKMNTLVANVERMRGPKGEDGAPGTPGVNGSPDTAVEIAGKLNTTTESVDQSVIKGLTKKLLEIERAIRIAGKGKSAGGGGMGNVQEEHTALTALSTTVSTNFPISQNGYGIMGVYINGQQLDRGTHYTVGGDRRTITLLITPQDGTTFTIIYVR